MICPPPTSPLSPRTRLFRSFSLAISSANSGEPVQRFPISVSNVRLVKFVIICHVNRAGPDDFRISQVRLHLRTPQTAIQVQSVDTSTLMIESHTTSPIPHFC